MAFGALFDLRPSMNTGEFRALLLVVVGWRREPALDAQRLDRTIDAYRNNANVRVLGFMHEGRPVGMIAIEVEPAAEGVIRQIAVLPEWRGRGLGRALVRDAALHLGLVTITAETDRNAVGFYERSGFRVLNLGEKYPATERFLCTWSSAPGG
jgi:ribosomal protein S18 acetylase RimI-like enzyme